MKARIAVWLTIGVWIIMPSTVHAQVVAPQPSVAKTFAVLPQDVAFARFISLIRGHLLTGDELVGQREWDAASPHFNFPREEIYGIIREQLVTYKTPQFDGVLKVLARAVKAHNAKQYQMAKAKVEGALAAADAGLKAKAPSWPRFVVAVAIEVLKTAPDEYDDAIGTGRNLGRIMRPIGYQTARGFVLQAERMFENVADDLGSINAIALSGIRTGFAELKQLFIKVKAPKQAIIDYSVFVGIISKIELAAGKLM